MRFFGDGRILHTSPTRQRGNHGKSLAASGSAVDRTSLLSPKGEEIPVSHLQDNYPNAASIATAHTLCAANSTRPVFLQFRKVR